MNKNKRKILFCSEVIYASTGFSRYYREILERLYNTNKFEIAELASYGYIDDPRNNNIKWKWYANAVRQNDKRFDEYISNPQNNFNAWRFNKVLLDFKPSICVDFRDFWMMEHEQESPLKSFFHWCICPTCDSSPIQPRWIEMCKNADSVFTYTDYSLNVINKESNNKVNTKCSALAAVDHNIFSPAKDNKSEHKKKMMFKPDIYIIGMVGRNQKRKLYPDLFMAFERFLNYCYENNNNELAKKTFLFIHTSLIDHGWNIGQLLKERNIGHKVLFSYICRDCKKWFPAFYSDAKTICPFCGNLSAITPCTEIGVSDEQLADIYRCFDIYTQYAICEGLGIPQLEAAACSIPVFAVNYSAMEDVIKKLDGIKLELSCTFRELETGAFRVYPDINDTVKKWYNFLISSDSYKNDFCNKMRKNILKYYTWEKMSAIWEDYLENCELKGLQGKWNSPPEFIQPHIRKDFNDLSNKDFVRYLILDVLQRPSELYKLRTLHLLSVLNYGAEVDGRKIRQIKREEIHNAYINMVKNHNYCEEIRCGLRPLPQEDFIEYANMRMDS